MEKKAFRLPLTIPFFLPFFSFSSFFFFFRRPFLIFIAISCRSESGSGGSVYFYLRNEKDEACYRYGKVEICAVIIIFFNFEINRVLH